MRDITHKTAQNFENPYVLVIDFINYFSCIWAQCAESQRAVVTDTSVRSMNEAALSDACYPAFETCPNITAARTRLEQLCLWLGLDGFLYQANARSCARQHTRFEVGFTLSNYDREWLRLYDERDYEAVDPALVHVLANVTPFLWESGHYRSKAAREFRETARNYGIDCAATVPVHGPLGDAAAFTVFAGSRRDGPVVAKRRLASALPYACLLAPQLHERIRNLTKPARPGTVSLTKRERECLRWIAAGKSTWEIGRILNITEHGVTHHIRNIMRKFDCTSRYVAASRAMALGLI